MVVPLSTRIRRARSLASLTQSALAKRLDVKRSAVSQWEAAFGTTPSVAHLIQIARETEVCFEWLATGRGEVTPNNGDYDSAVALQDYAHDELETRGLAALRQMSRQKKHMAVAIVELMNEVGR